MDQSEKDAGTIAALILRMDEYRLPRAKRLLDDVTQGQKIRETDINFLKRVYRDYQANQSLIKRNPEYSQLMFGFIDLYAEIITRGLENERAG